jgi:N-acetylneuraminate synthase
MATSALRTWLGDTATSSSGCFVIGEVAQAHDGSLGTAHAYIDAIARAGADAVKFQTHLAAAESTPAEPWRVRFSPADASRYDYWKRMEFSEEHWAGLKRHADDAGLCFLSSPFSIEALELLARIGVPAWKVASGEIATTPLLDAMVTSGLPLLVSTGMSTMAEIDALVCRLRERAARFALFQCTTAYPCPPERIGLNMLATFRQRYNCAVGLSDHSGTIFPGLAAATLGADAIEVHVTLSRESFGPDVCASVTTTELATLVDGVRSIARMLDHPVDKDREAESTAPARALFGKSIVARVPLAAGTVLRHEFLAAKKPGHGIPVARLADVATRRLRRDVRADEPIRFEDLDPVE